MSGLYGDLWAGPTYRPVSQGEQIAAAFDQPMNMGATFWDQAKGGVVESFGLGTELRRWQIPEGNLGNLSPAERLRRQTEGVPNPLRDLGELGKTLGVIPDQPSDVSPDLSEDAWKSSPYYRAEIPWDPSMTEARAQALAAWHDTAKTREYFASKRPITAFLGNIAGQAVDPINYIPLAGQVVKEANLLRMALSGATDAAANTAIFDLATRDARGRYGDDVSWQTTISQIATAALIGGAFGGVVGAVDNVLSTRAAARAQVDLVPVKAAQEARIALNEAIDAVVHAEPVRLTPNATDAISQAMEVRNPARSADLFADLQRTDIFGSTAVGRVIDQRPVNVIEFEDFIRQQTMAKEPELAQRYRQAEEKFNAAQDRLAAIEEGIATRTAADTLDLIDQPAAERLRAVEAELAANPKASRRAALEAERAMIVDSVGQDVIARAENDFRIGPSKQAKQARKVLATARQEFAKARRDVDALAVRDEAVANVRRAVVADASGPRPEPVPQSRIDAEPKVGKPETVKSLAEDHAVEPSGQTYPEMAEIDQLRIEGRLSDEDLAELDAADSIMQDGDAYGNALEAVTRCML